MSTWRTAEEVLEDLRVQLSSRAVDAFKLADAFRRADVDGSGSLEEREFEEALLYCGVSLSVRDLHLVMRRLDESRDGKLQYGEFMAAVRRDMGERRRNIVHKAFVAATSAGCLTAEDFARFYHAEDSELVVLGRTTAAAVRERFRAALYDVLDELGHVRSPALARCATLPGSPRRTPALGRDIRRRSTCPSRPSRCCTLQTCRATTRSSRRWRWPGA